MEPRPLSAPLFGYARMRHGFAAAVLLHTLGNAYLILLFG